MSAFSDNGDNPQNTTTETTSFVEQLVGEGKKFRDVEELAKGKLEADRYIEQIKAEAQASTESLNSKLEELISRLSEQNKNTSQSNSDGSHNTNNDGSTNTDMKTNTQSPMDAASVEALVQEAMKKTQTEAKRQENLSKVEQELTKTFGERSSEVVQSKARELGMSVKDLQSFAEKSPVGFLELVGASRSGGTPGSIASSVTSHSSQVSSNEKLPENERWSYFKELKKSNPKQFYLNFDKMQAAIDKYGSDVFYKS